MSLLSVHDSHLGCFDTCSGIRVNIHSPAPEMFHINDIAKGLANVCRFGGQISHHYSVAQHSLIVAFLAPPELQKAALLHDAPEAYLGDVIKPLKVILGEAYARIERDFERVIFEVFGIPLPLLEQVKEYDRLALEMEHDHFFKKGSWLEDTMSIMGYPAPVFDQRTAYLEFLQEYQRLFHPVPEKEIRYGGMSELTRRVMEGTSQGGMI